MGDGSKTTQKVVGIYLNGHLQHGERALDDDMGKCNGQERRTRTWCKCDRQLCVFQFVCLHFKGRRGHGPPAPPPPPVPAPLVVITTSSMQMEIKAITEASLIESKTSCLCNGLREHTAKSTERVPLCRLDGHHTQGPI